MGGLAVLQPRDCLKDGLPRGNLSYSHMNIRRNPNPNFSKSNRRKRSPPRLVEEKQANNGNNMKNKSRHTEVTEKRSILVMDGSNNNNKSKSRHTEITAKSPVMGQVKILKRGEELKETTVAETDAAAAAKDESVEVKKWEDLGSDRLGPEPETMSKQVRISDFYAGSAVILSPPPSSLPFPGFVVTKAAAAATSVLANNKNKNGDVANDLRRILRLDY